MDAIAFLRADHVEVLGMLDELDSGPTARADRTPPVRHARKEIVTRLVIAESRHEAVEEQYFWPMVRDQVPDGDALANQAVDQEYAAKQVLDALDKADPGQSDFEAMIERVVRDGREHIRFEQDEVWPRVRACVSEQRLAEVGDKMAAAKAKAPTRPHPETPSSAGVQKTVGKAAAALDRARDAVTGRDKEK